MSVVIKLSLLSPSISPAERTRLSWAKGLNRLAFGRQKCHFFYDEESVNEVFEQAWVLEHVGSARPAFQRTFFCLRQCVK